MTLFQRAPARINVFARNPSMLEQASSVPRRLPSMLKPKAATSSFTKAREEMPTDSPPVKRAWTRVCVDWKRRTGTGRTAVTRSLSPTCMTRKKTRARSSSMADVEETPIDLTPRRNVLRCAAKDDKAYLSQQLMGKKK